MVEILEENTQREDADIGAKRQAVVLSLWEEICDAFNHGWSYKEIWKGLEREGVVDFGYWSFMHYVRKIRQRLVGAERGVPPSISGSKAGENQGAAAKPAPGSTKVEIPGFGRNLPPRDPKKF